MNSEIPGWVKALSMFFTYLLEKNDKQKLEKEKEEKRTGK